MLTVNLEMVLTIVVMSTPPYLVGSARHGTARNHTSMDMKEKELTISVVTQMVRHMPGVIQ